MPAERVLNLTAPPDPGTAAHCCAQMQEQVDRRCAQHPDPLACPDCLIYYAPVFAEYGIIVHDDSSTYVLISHCPWCGARLPASRRDAWFDRLAELGFDAPLAQDIPPAFRSDAWYRTGGP